VACFSPSTFLPFLQSLLRSSNLNIWANDGRMGRRGEGASPCVAWGGGGGVGAESRDTY
jgi:hypothetical protein